MTRTKENLNKESIIIIGNGVAANVLGYYLRHSAGADITKVYDDSLMRPTTQLSTAHNCLRNSKRGLSKLGDLLVDASEEFDHFYKMHQPQGVYPSHHIHLWRDDYSKAHKLHRRYQGNEYQSKNIPYFVSNFKKNMTRAENDAYVIDPKIYMEWLEEKTKYSKVINEQVQKIEENELLLRSGKKLTYDRLYLCTGQYTKYFQDIFLDQTHLVGSKPVAGTYLEFDLKDFNKEEFYDLEKAFCFDIEEVNFVYKPDSKTILLGATSTLGKENYLHDLDIEKMYAKIKTVLSGILTLPAYEKARVITGIRQKGHRRLPFWGEIRPNIFAVYGLYKNAFTFSNLAAKFLTSC
jgi:hypothetical protein